MINQKAFKIFNNVTVKFIRRETISTAFGGTRTDENVVWEGRANEQSQPRELQKLIEQGIDGDLILYIPEDGVVENTVKVQDKVIFDGGRVGVVVETNAFNKKLIIKLRE